MFVWPVGPAAERLAGAVVLFTEGRVRLRDWSNTLAGERVLLVAVAAATPIALVAAAEHARALGAVAVHACGVAVQGAERSDFCGAVDGYVPLEIARYDDDGAAAPGGDRVARSEFARDTSGRRLVQEPTSRAG